MSLTTFLTGRMPVRSIVLMVWALATVVFAAKSEALFGLRNLDSDDVMRLVQIRDLLSGQGWFDLVQHRVSPDGLPMHWSRIVDGGVGGLILLFGSVFPPDLAERVAGAVWPTLLLLATLFAVASIAERLGGRRALPLGVLLFCLIGPAGAQFFPGRIDHHNIQILACLVTAAAILHLEKGRGAGVVAGLGAALMLTIGIETLPALVTLCAAAALMLALDPGGMRRGVAALGLSLALGSLALALLTVPVSQILAAHCDAVSAPYLAAAVVGGLGLASLASVGERLSTAQRFACMAAIGGFVVAAVAVFGPACLRGPVAEIDARLRPIWLNGVQEMEPLGAALLKGDALAVGSLGYLAFGMVALALLWPVADARRRGALAVVAALQVVGFLVAMGQIRGVYYANAFAAPLIAGGVTALQGRFRVPTGHRNAAALACLIVVSSFSMLGRLASTRPAQASSQASTDLGSNAGCADPVSFEALGRAPEGVVLAGVDLGPFVLSASRRHSVLGAPYHRNVAGILASHELMSAPVDQAEALLRNRSVAAVAFCGPLPYARQPGSLARALEDGMTPAWLKPLETGTAVKLFVLR